MTNKFYAWDWDLGAFRKINSEEPVEAIHTAWNYEFDVYAATEDGEKHLIFRGYQDNDTNTEMLKPYGLRLIDAGDGYRRLQNVKTGEIYKPIWESE